MAPCVLRPVSSSSDRPSSFLTEDHTDEFLNAGAYEDEDEEF